FTEWFAEGNAMAARAAKLVSVGRDVYYAPAAFGDAVNARGHRTRSTANVVGVSSLWVDLDCGAGQRYPDQAAGLGVLGQLRGSDFGIPTSVVGSGSGLHLYYSLDRPVDRTEHLSLAQSLLAAYRAAGIIIKDPSCTTDTARLLRVPGTFNFKNPAQPRL